VEERVICSLLAPFYLILLWMHYNKLSRFLERKNYYFP
jgi:hypothetical protein